MKMRRPSFLMILIAVGLLLAIAMGADLLFRGTERFPPDPRWSVEGGDPARGRIAIATYGCGGCHVIPGIREATGRVGPQLIGFRDQIYIGGVLPNTPEDLVAWLQNPQHASPRTAMPNLRVTEADARDIAAYLYSRKR